MNNIDLHTFGFIFIYTEEISLWYIFHNVYNIVTITWSCFYSVKSFAYALVSIVIAYQIQGRYE